MHASLVAALFVLGFAGLWFGLVEDIKIAFAFALLVLVSATLVTFSGRPGEVPPPRSRSSISQSRQALDVRAMALPLAVAGGLVFGAVCIWLGLVEDIKIAMLVGIVVWAGAVMATFSGKATRF